MLFPLPKTAEAARLAGAYPLHPGPGHAQPRQFPLPKPHAPLALSAAINLHPGQARSGFSETLERPPLRIALAPASPDPSRATRAAVSARSQTLSPASRAPAPAPAPRAAPGSPPRPACRALGVVAVLC